MADAGSAESVVPQPPQTLGRYTLLSQIAVGGMAEIFLARQQGVAGFEKILVIKKILGSYAANPEFVEMFLDEARIASQLSHPNIVQIFDLGQAGGTYYIAMEYLAGEPLSRVLRRARRREQPLPLHLAAQIVAQAADGLHYAHTATDAGGRPLNIVHRDISPDNLVLTYTGGVKVVDFGIATAANKASHTGQGQMKGKLAYMSPEQANGVPVDPRSDVFSLGLVLFEALTGGRMFPQEDPVSIFRELLHAETLPRASSRNAAVPFELDEVVAAALRVKREDRYQSAQDLKEALNEWLRRSEHDPQVNLASLMTSSFAAERERRLRMIDQAARGEPISNPIITNPSLEASLPGRRPALANPTATGPHARPPSAALAAPMGSPPKPTPVLRPAHSARFWLGGGALLVALGLGGAVALRSSPASLPTQPLPTIVPAATGTLLISASPAEVHVFIDGTDRGVPPVRVAELGLGAHQIVARLAGRSDLTRSVLLERNGQSIDMTLEMPPIPAAPVPVVAAAPATPVVAPASSVPSANPKSDAVAVAPARKRHGPEGSGSPAPAATGGGTLNLNSTPWAEVSIDGKAVGETPLIGVALSAGPHSVHLVNPDVGQSQTVTVTITAGQLTAKTVKF